MSTLPYFFISFAFNLLVAFVLVRFIYYPSTHNKRYVLTFLAFNTVIYFVLHFMTSVEISVGVGFGLFAIFTILRYRTDPLPVREMTYLFLIAALPVMNSSSKDTSLWPQLVSANLLILLIMFLLEKGWGFQYESTRRIIYEKIELIRPDRHAELLADLEERTGLKIKRISVGKISFLKDTAELTIHYDAPRHDGWDNHDSPVVTVYRSADSDD